MSNVEIHQVQGLHVKLDVVSEACLACSYGVFIGNLLLVNDHRFKVLKLKSNHVPQAIQNYDVDVVKSSEDAVTCEQWLRYSIHNGYFQTLEEVFPKMFWHTDFHVYDYQHDIEGLVGRLKGVARLRVMQKS